MTIDISYLEQGYIDQRYFVRVANADGRLDATSSQQALSTKFRGFQGALAVDSSFNADALEIIGSGTRTYITLVGNLNG
jgi:hypothetical protein